MDVRTQTPDRMAEPKPTVEEMLPLVEQYKRKDLVRSGVLCKARHLVWAVELLEAEGSPGDCSRGFVEIGSAAPWVAAQVEIAYPGGIRVRFFAPVSASYLAKLTQS